MNIAFNQLGGDVSYAHRLTIYLNDGSVAGVFCTDLAQDLSYSSEGNVSSQNSANNLQINPNQFAQIISIGRSFLLSRELSGAKFELDLLLYKPGLQVLRIQTGVVGEIKLDSPAAELEIISNFEKLVKPSRYRLLQTCTNIYGEKKCTSPRDIQHFDVVSRVGRLITVSTPVSLSSPYKYQAKIGDDTYYVISASGSVVRLDRVPLGEFKLLTISVRCDKKIETCRLYGHADEYIGGWLPANSLSIVL